MRDITLAGLSAAIGFAMGIQSYVAGVLSYREAYTHVLLLCCLLTFEVVVIALVIGQR